MEIAKYISDGTTRTYAPPCTFKAALNLGVYVNNSYIDRNDYELIRGQVLFKSTTVPATGTIVEIRVDNTVSDISTASLDDLNICANNIANINSVANRIDDVLALAPFMASIEIVADNIANITEIHTTIIPNITEILNADTNAGIATTQATNATNQASNALTSANTAIDRATVATAAASNALSYRDSASASATTATNKATDASTYASNASTSATLAQGYANDASTSKNTTQGYMTTTEGYKNTTQGYMNNASTSATNASNSATNAASTLSNFNSKYTSSATAPASPTEGMLWYDTATNIMKVYDGSGWINAGSSVNGTSSRNTYTATAGQTTFSATYDSGYVDVYRNGLKLSNSDFVATNGTTIVLNNACSLNDVVDIVAYGNFELADAYTKNDSDVLLSAKADKASPTFTGTPTVNGVAFGGYSGFKNYIINGKKQINQRGSTSTDNSYNQDRWYKVGNNWYQGIEGDNNLINGKTYTLSWVGNATASYYIGSATSATINSQSFAAISNGGSFTLTISAGQNLWVKFESDSTGSTFSFVQLEEGSVATPFEQRPVGLELSLCQRYYEKILTALRAYADGPGFYWTIPMKVNKRNTPSVIQGTSYTGANVSPTTGVIGVSQENIAYALVPNTVGFCNMDNLSLEIISEL